MRPVSVDTDAAVMHEIVQIAADLRPALEDQDVAAGIDQGAGDCRAHRDRRDSAVDVTYPFRYSRIRVYPS